MKIHEQGKFSKVLINEKKPARRKDHSRSEHGLSAAEQYKGVKIRIISWINCHGWVDSNSYVHSAEYCVRLWRGIMRLRGAAFVAAIIVTAIASSASADSICGPGRHLADGAWKCLPGDGRTSSVPAQNNNRANQVAAGVALGGALFSIIQSLASQSRMTDDNNSIDPALKQHANQSRKYNREGLGLQRAGRYDEARKAFQKAANEALEAGNVDDSIANNRNAEIADSLHWLKRGYEAEKAGKKTKANIAYKMGMNAAQRAGADAISAQIEQANDALVSKGGGKRLLKSETSCQLVNGKLACSE